MLRSFFSAVSPEQSAELPGSYIALLARVPTTAEQADSGPRVDLGGEVPDDSCSMGEFLWVPVAACGVACGAVQNALPEVLFALYKQARPLRLQGLLVQGLVPTGLAILFCALTLTLHPVVATLNVAVPVGRLAFSIAFYRPLLHSTQVRIIQEGISAARLGQFVSAEGWMKEGLSGPPVPPDVLGRLFRRAWPEVFARDVLARSGRGMGDHFAAAFAVALQSHVYLRTLDLCSNTVGQKGARALADLLQTSGSLRELRLNGNQLGDTGARALAAALKGNVSLKVLSLRGNQIGHPGAMALAEALRVNRSLEMLDLGGNPIGEAAQAALEQERWSRGWLDIRL